MDGLYWKSKFQYRFVPCLWRACTASHGGPAAGDSGGRGEMLQCRYSRRGTGHTGRCVRVGLHQNAVWENSGFSGRQEANMGWCWIWTYCKVNIGLATPPDAKGSLAAGGLTRAGPNATPAAEPRDKRKTGCNMLKLFFNNAVHESRRRPGRQGGTGGVAVTSPRSGTGAAKRGLSACSARVSALAAAERLPTIHWEKALKERFFASDNLKGLV